MNFPVAGWYLSSPPSMVPAHIFPSLSSCRLQIKFPLMLWASPGSLRNTVKVYPSYLFNPSRVPIQIKPFRSCSMQVALLMESPWVVERFLNLKYGCCACAGRGLHAAKAEMISRYLIMVEGWFMSGLSIVNRMVGQWKADREDGALVIADIYISAMRSDILFYDGQTQACAIGFLPGN